MITYLFYYFNLLLLVFCVNVNAFIFIKWNDDAVTSASWPRWSPNRHKREKERIREKKKGWNVHLPISECAIVFTFLLYLHGSCFTSFFCNWVMCVLFFLLPLHIIINGILCSLRWKFSSKRKLKKNYAHNNNNTQRGKCVCFERKIQSIMRGVPTYEDWYTSHNFQQHMWTRKKIAKMDTNIYFHLLIYE